MLYALYLGTRLYALMLLPMFLDERIHLRWAYWISHGHRLRLPFISGRGLSVWLLAAVVPLAPDPLLAGRLLTVAVGALTLWACHEIGRRLYGLRAGVVAAVLYVLCPFTLFHDRMVLTDAFLSAFGALAGLYSIELVRRPRMAAGLVLGVVIGLGIASKTTGLVLLAWPLAAAVLLKARLRSLAAPLATAVVTAAAIAAYPVWLFFCRTRELKGAIGVRENESDIASNTATNASLALGWLGAYWTPGLAVLALAGFVVGILRRTHTRESLLLAIFAVGPAIAFAAIAQVWYPRYLLVTAVPMLLLAAAGTDALLERIALDRPATRVIGLLGLGVALAPALGFDFRLWTDPSRAPFPALDRFQYVTGWPSGYGVADTVEYVRRRIADHPAGITIVSPGPSVAAGTLRMLGGRGLPVDILYLDASDPASLATLVGHARRGAAYVLVSPIQGGRLPAAWATTVTRVFVSFKPEGTVTDELYVVCLTGACGP